jgi:two-component system nitrogen regulation response regulator GlnG
VTRRVRAALQVDTWADEVVGGRVVRIGHDWRDMATAAPVTLRAWLVDETVAARWADVHGDALDAWVLSNGVGWVGVRLDATGAHDPSTSAAVEVPVWLTGTEPVVTDWPAAAVMLRRAGVVPVCPAAVPLLATRPAAWWGDIAVLLPTCGLDARGRMALDAFEAAGGRVVRLIEARSARGRVGHRERHTMRDMELLDVLDRMEQAGDDREALRVICCQVQERLGAQQAGIATAGGQAVVMVGSGEPPPQTWLAASLRESRPLPLETGTARLLAAPALDVTGCVGGLWAGWPLDRPLPVEGPSLLGVCARLGASRLAAWVTTEAATPSPSPRLIGDGPLMVSVRAQLARVARSPFPVLLFGESGSGKELAARTVHEAGPRRARRFVAVNCAALPDDLVEAELFGHARGAYTGAVGERAGVFEEADGGTLFLDEVGDLSVRAQAKLLRVLQEGEVRRLGDNGPRRVDVRLIAATNVPLEEAVAAGRFRADLYYRLAVVCVRLPALRERRDDIPQLVAHLWAECARRVGTQARLHPSLVADLAEDDWPGNVRELQNVLAALAVEAPRRGVVSARGARRVARPRAVTASAPAADGGPALDAARRQFEASFVREALVRAGGRRTEAARRLGLSRQGLTKLVRRLGLDRPHAASGLG